MDPDPLPSLLNDDIRNAGIDHPGRLEHHVAVLEEVPQGGSGGSDTKKATDHRASDPLDSGVAGALAVEGPVYLGNNVLGIVWAKLEPCVVGELKSSFVYRRHWGGETAWPCWPSCFGPSLRLQGVLFGIPYFGLRSMEVPLPISRSLCSFFTALGFARGTK